MSKHKLHFKVIVPFYNVEKWLGTNIDSILGQEYENYSCYYIDDMSTDNSLSLLGEYANNKKINVIKNTEKKYALRNIVEAIDSSNPSDEDVIVTVDGDDWLASPDVFSKVADVYEKEDVLMTYGTYIDYPSGRRPHNVKEYPTHIIESNSYRKDTWRASHLRTFKYKLWKNIKREDLLDEEGEFYRMAWDLAFMFPMLEMAAGRTKYISDPLYIYNQSNPINDHKVDHRLQLSLDSKIRRKKAYSPIFEKEEI